MADDLTFGALAAQGASSLSAGRQARRARNNVGLTEEVTAAAPPMVIEQAQLNFAAMQLDQKMEIINFLTLLMGRPSRPSMARTG